MKFTGKVIALLCLVALTACDKAEEVATDVADNTKKVGEVVTDTAKGAAAAGTDAVKAVGGKVEDLASKAVESTKAAAGQVADAVTPADHEIKMLNMGKDGSMVFEPGFLKVKPGETVKFVSTDPGHNSVSFFSPEGGSTWDGKISKDVTVTFDKEGVYLYKCFPHLIMAMVGVIQVGEATNKEAAIEAGQATAKKFALNKHRFDDYLAKID